MMFDRVLPGYWRSHPEVTLDIDVARTSEIAQHHRRPGLYRPGVPAANDARLRAYSRPEPIRAIVRDDHPLTRLRRPLLLTDLADYPGAAMQGRLRRAPAHPGRRDQRTGAAAQC